LPLCADAHGGIAGLAWNLQRRHRSDNKVNNRKSWVLREGQLVEARWRTVVVGEIIKLENDQFVAVSLLRYSTAAER